MNKHTQKLLKALPKKYHNRVKSLEIEDDLVDDCKYMLYWSDLYTSDGEDYGSCYPVKSISEAKRFIIESLFR